MEFSWLATGPLCSPFDWGEFVQWPPAEFNHVGGMLGADVSADPEEGERSVWVFAPHVFVAV